MPIYKKTGYGTVMGFTDEELKEKPKKKNIYKDMMSQRVMRCKSLY